MKTSRAIRPGVDRRGQRGTSTRGLFTTVVLIPKPERAEAAAIELADIKKRKEPPKPPPPPPPPPQEKPKPPPPPPRAQAQAKAAPDSAKAAAPAALMPMSEDGFADLGGVALGNGGGGDGVAIPSAAGPRAAAAGAGGTCGAQDRDEEGRAAARPRRAPTSARSRWCARSAR